MAIKVIAVILLISFALFLLFKPIDYEKYSFKLSELMAKVLSENKIKNPIKEAFTKKKYGRIGVVEIYKEYKVSPVFSFDKFKKSLNEELLNSNYRLGKSEFTYNAFETIALFQINFKGMSLYRLVFRQPKVTEFKIPSRPAKKIGKAALVLDDWGYNMDNLQTLFDINRPITLAILPGQRYSSTIAASAKQKGYETILHMPMEPLNKNAGLEPGTILCSMNKNQILDLLNKAKSNVKGISGISNHQGSKATEDVRVMRIVFDWLKANNLYFLDSFVTENSVCKLLAQHMDMRFEQRSIFIDNKEESEYIRKQLMLIPQMLKHKRSIVIIGHDRATTLQTLRAVMPILEEYGVEFVTLSDLVD